VDVGEAAEAGGHSVDDRPRATASSTTRRAARTASRAGRRASRRGPRARPPPAPRGRASRRRWAGRARGGALIGRTSESSTAAALLPGPVAARIWHSDSRKGGMADWTLMALQLRGKTRRFVQASVLRQDAAPLLAKRRGECNRCGACCKILFRCPFLGEDAEGSTPAASREALHAVPALPPAHGRPPGARGPVQLLVEAVPSVPAPGELPEPALE